MSAPPRLVLILGDESLLAERAVAQVVAAARKVDPEVERRDTEAAGLTPAGLANLLAPSLFVEPRVVVISGAAEAGKELAAALLAEGVDPPEGVTMVVRHQGGARNKPLVDGLRKAGAGVLSCDRITRLADRIEFVRQEIRRAGGLTTPEAAGVLVEAVGSDLRELASAASQLVADTGGRVDDTAVRRYHQGRAEVSGFTVADLVVAGDTAGALEALRWASTIGVAPVLIADALADGIRTMGRVVGIRSGSSYALASELGLPPWKIDKARQAVRYWSEPGLVTAMTVVAELNGAVKGLAADPEYVLERAVLDLAAARARPADNGSRR